MINEPSQLELGGATAEAAPSEDLRLLIALLEVGGWVKSDDLIRMARSWDRDWTRTVINNLAASSVEIISSALGYKLVKHATADEVRHFLNSMESRAKAEMERAAAVRKRARQILG